MSDKEEIMKIKAIKEDLLSLDCPHIDITEDDYQIKNLLLENSNYRQELVKWLLETLTDSVEFDIDEALQTLGLDLKSLSNWELALSLVCGKKINSESGLDGLRQARHYLDFLMSSNLGTPMAAMSNSKSNLIPRDIEKDVLNRIKKEEDMEKISMQTNELTNTQRVLIQEKSTFEQFITSDFNQLDNVGHKKANEKVDKVLEVVQKYRKDYEQDFKPWTDRSEAPDTNETLENLIQNMHVNVKQIHQNLENNSKLRQSTIAITEVLKQL